MNNKNEMVLAVKTIFNGIFEDKLTKEEAFKQIVIDGKTAVDIFQEAIDEDNAKKVSGTLYSHQATYDIIRFFKLHNNDWATRSDIIEFLRDIYNRSDDALWGHIYRAKEVAVLEHDQDNKVYRLAIN